MMDIAKLRELLDRIKTASGAEATDRAFREWAQVAMAAQPALLARLEAAERVVEAARSYMRDGGLNYLFYVPPSPPTTRRRPVADMTDGYAPYAERDVMALDREGGYYIRHVFAMTKYGLHDKSDIAAELAWRDQQIATLRAEIADMREELDATIEQRDLLSQEMLRLEKDAGRYAWLATKFRSGGLKMDGTSMWYLPASVPGVRALTLDAAIDAAIAEESRHD